MAKDEKTMLRMPCSKCKCGSRKLLFRSDLPDNEILVGRKIKAMLCRCQNCGRWMRYYPATGLVSYGLSPRERADIERVVAQKPVRIPERKDPDLIARRRETDTREFLRNMCVGE